MSMCDRCCNGPLVFTDDVSADGYGWVNSKVHRSMLTALRNAIVKGQQFKVTRHKLREQPRIFSVQETGYSWVAPSWFQHSGAYFSGAVGRSESKKTYKQTASESSCSEGLRKETQHWISSMGSRSQAVVKCKGFIANVSLLISLAVWVKNGYMNHLGGMWR